MSYLTWESKHLERLSLSNFPEFLTVSPSRCMLAIVVKVAFQRFQWVWLFPMADQRVRVVVTRTRQLLNHRPSRPGFPQYHSNHKLPLVLECLTPSDV